RDCRGRNELHMQRVMIALAALMISSLHGIVRADAPAPSAELRALEDMIGTWDEVMTNKPTDWVPKAGTSTAATRRTWSLGGKFIRADGAWQPAGTEFLHLMSY